VGLNQAQKKEGQEAPANTHSARNGGTSSKEKAGEIALLPLSKKEKKSNFHWASQEGSKEKKPAHKLDEQA